ELAVEHALRPAVGRDVVDRDHEDVVVLPEPQDPRAEERPAGEVERSSQLAGALAACRVLASLDGGHRERDGGGFVYDGDRRSASGLEGGAEHLVAADDLAEG